MKLIIVFLCIIGFAMCTKSADLISTSTNKWTVKYYDVGNSTTITRNMSLVIDSGTASGNYHTAVSSEVHEVGVVCLSTSSNFTLTAATASIATFVLAASNDANTATTSAASTNWAALGAYSTTSTYTSDTVVVLAASPTTCTLTTPSTPTVVAAEFSVTYSWTTLTANACANLPMYNTTTPWYKCMYLGSTVNTAALSTAGSRTVSQVTNVTIGASTYAIGATILAGTAYLSF